MSLEDANKEESKLVKKLSDTPKPTKWQNKKFRPRLSLLKLSENFVNEIGHDENHITNEIFKQYFGYQNPSFLAKNLLQANQAKNNQIVN